MALPRIDIKAILRDPVRRRELSIRFIMAAQHMEHIDTTYEQAAHAYDTVQAEKAAKKNKKGRAR